MLRREPRLEPMTLFDYLVEKYPGQYQSVLRTLQRRVQTWKALHDDTKEVIELRHEAGEMGLSDFTEVSDLSITIAGKPFEHILYHYRLAGEWLAVRRGNPRRRKLYRLITRTSKCVSCLWRDSQATPY